MAGINNNLIHINDISPSDIRLGRGGHATNSASHQRFLDYKDLLRRLYLLATSNREKRIIQQRLVDYVHQQLGGRFIRRVNAIYFMEISSREALQKCANTLREDRIRHRNAILCDGNDDIKNGPAIPDVAFDIAPDGRDVVNDEIDIFHNELDFFDNEFDFFDGWYQGIYCSLK